MVWRWLVVLCIVLAARASNAAPPRGIAADAQVARYELTPELAERAESRAWTSHVEEIVGMVYGLALLSMLVRFRVGVRYQRIAERVAKRRILQSLVFAPLFVVTFQLLLLPQGIVSQAILRAYDLSIQSWGSFVIDWAMDLVVMAILGTIVIAVLYAVLRRSPRRWWLWTWVALLPLLVFVLFLQPLVVDPLFYRFEPLAAKHPGLVAKIQTLAEHAGEDLPADRIFEMKASNKLNEINAYVTGIGASKRLVVWDTTLEAMNDREIVFVVGHELGHYVLGHVWRFLVAGAAGLLVALFGTARVLAWVIARRGERWGIARVDDFASLPLLALIFVFISNIGQPIFNVYQRTKEHEADAFGLAASRGVVDDPAQAAAHAFVRLGEVDLEEPDPGSFWVWWHYNHAPLRDRVRFVLEARSGGEP
jgi:Zn-dependent protease with chaperone function